MIENYTLSEKQKSLLTKKGFIDRYYENCHFYSTKDAYTATERQYVAIVGERKYKNWDSFKVVKNKFLKDMKKGNEVSTCFKY